MEEQLEPVGNLHAARADIRNSVLSRLSAFLARVEILVAGALVFLLFALLLANVAGRYFGSPLIWVDELAIYLMIFVAFLAASAAIDARQHIAVTLVPDFLSRRGAAWLRLLADAILLVFMLTLCWMIWRWFDPLALQAAGSVQAFSAETFNFIYQEPTVTLGMRKVWFWLIMPVFGVLGTIHCAAQIENDFRILKELNT